jgi:hypothetical protein
MSETITGNKIRFINGKVLTIKPTDARRLVIDVSSVAFLDTEKNEDNNITAVNLEGKYTIRLKDTIKMRIGKVDSLYEVNYILISKDKKSILLFSSTPTKTSTFLLPLLRKTKKVLKFNSYFVNAFLDGTLEHICLLYRFTGTQLYKEFEENIMKDTLCVTHMEYDPYHVVYIFKIPEEFLKDIEHFKAGAYSKFSEGLKREIWKFYGQEDGGHIMNVVNKSKELKKELEKFLGTKLPKDAELASKPTMEKEIFYKYKKYKHEQEK